MRRVGQAGAFIISLWAFGCAAPKVPSVQSIHSVPDGYVSVKFIQLASFKYIVPDGAVTEPSAKAVMAANRIPDKIAALDGKLVAVEGYMLPLRVEAGRITEFLVLRDQSLCCYGAVPKINEFIFMRTPAGQGIPAAMDRKITFLGRLRVGEVIENDYLVGIYEMDAEPRFVELK